MVVLPLAYNPNGGLIVDAAGREIAYLAPDIDDEVAVELLLLVNRSVAGRSAGTCTATS